MGEPADFSAPRQARLGMFVLVTLLHLLVIVGLIRAFAPDFTRQAVNTVLSTFAMTAETPPSAETNEAGKAGEAGKKAAPKPVTAPKPRVPIARPSAAPRVSGSGAADSSGAKEAGAGTGAGGSGEGAGSGPGGSGQGGGGVTKALHVSGEINNAADFPIPPGGREARVGKAVILALTISPNGRATACRVYRSSGFPDTDAAACRLAIERLGFKPATNAAGEPVTSTFYWQQKFFF
jgi:protein TonB